MRAGGFVVIRGACRATGAAVAVALLLAGCAQEPRPQPTFATLDPLPTPSPTPTVEPVTKPERPAEMDRTDEVGAAAAAEYFLELYQYVLATGDFSEWGLVANPGCDFCSSVQGWVEPLYSSGGRYEGGRMSLSSPKATSADPATGTHTVALLFEQASGRELDQTGTEIGTGSASSGMIRVEVFIAEIGWVLVEVWVDEELVS
ncbi:DUF6318 family protein [Actinotalea sp. K2]|uniref:DUF6318 family protein n=1 Tax=Actinotalea sp. K2 TaxID=2939438 RepID=UPI002017BF8E|nr:DUF6318 family protein [Actinotalea sp. K2]MCL3863100.1 DUF6318 family protein [Actinotalea sp. K2]